MTPRQKRNLTIAKLRRIEKARAAYVDAYANMVRLASEASQGRMIPASHVPEWYGQSPKGVTVN